MEPALILRTSTVLLAIAAAGGLVMAGIRFASDRQPPAALAMLHGFLAAAGMTLLLYGAATVGLPGMAVGALVLFLVAAGGASSSICSITGSKCHCRSGLSSYTRASRSWRSRCWLQLHWRRAAHSQARLCFDRGPTNGQRPVSATAVVRPPFLSVGRQSEGAAKRAASKGNSWPGRAVQ